MNDNEALPPPAVPPAHRPGGRCARILAASQQPPRRRPRAVRLHARAACGLAQASERHAMTRFGYVMVTYFAMLAAGALAFIHPAPRLIWNATASTPTG